MKIFVLLLFAFGLIQADDNITHTEKTVQNQRTQKALPQKQIVDVLIQWIEGWSDTNVTLDVHYLSYRNGWAWIETVPHYADGKKHEVKIDALLRKKDDKWKVVYVADNDDGLSRTERVKKDKTLQRFLKKPYGIVPLYIFDHNTKEKR